MLAMLRMYAVVFLLLPQILWLQYRWTGWAAGMVITSILAWFAAACVLNTLLTLDFDFFDVSQQKDKSVRHFWWCVCCCCSFVGKSPPLSFSAVTRFRLGM